MNKLLIFLILCCTCSVFSQNVTTDSIIKTLNQPVFKQNEIGIAAGYIIGYGLSYRRWFSEKNALMINAAPYYYKKSDEEYTSVDVGLTFIHRLTHFYEFNLVMYSGINVYYSSDTHTSYDFYYSYGPSQTNYVAIGGGPGIIYSMDNISLDLLVGYRFYNEQTDVNNRGLMPSIEVGAHFMF